MARVRKTVIKAVYVVACVLTKVGKPNRGLEKHKGVSRDFPKKTRFKPTSFPAHLFAIRESEKEALEHFKHMVKICPNRGHNFQNKLRNTWTVILKIFTKFLLN